MPDDSPTIGLRVVESLSAVEAEQWDACALAPGSAGNPFLSHRFLKALEDSKSVGRRTGWQPQYLLAETDDGTLQGAVPLYMKGHSQGEYVFDHGWAQAFERAGGRYYPKLQAAVPFTPVPGPRLFARPGPFEDGVRDAMIDMLAKIAGDNRISSVHATFCSEADWKQFGEHGWLLRLGQQYHWHNNGYRCFDDFLAALASRKRKAIRKEREAVRREGLTLHALCGDEIKPRHGDAWRATPSCISRPATTRPSTTRSRTACSGSRRVRRAITRSSAATCRCRPSRRIGSSIPAFAAPSTTISSANGRRSSRRSRA